MIRKARVSDYDQLIKIFSLAKEFMKKSGNPNQWKDDYPGVNFIEEIKNGHIYLLEDEKIYGVFSLLTHDPNYEYIKGEWLNDKPYLAIHRVASDGSRKKVFEDINDFALKKGCDLKIDTHKDNKVMQDIILRQSYKYCGIIYLANGEERLAYQLENK